MQTMGQGDVLQSTLLFRRGDSAENSSADIQKRLPQLAEEMSSIDLNKEQYGLTLDLEVAETVHNME